MPITGDTLFFIVEILGTIAFAISGAMIAIDRELDIFGVIMMACMTACGGGILRDMILGQTPPQSFINPVYLASAAASGGRGYKACEGKVRSQGDEDFQTC